MYMISLNLSEKETKKVVGDYTKKDLKKHFETVNGRYNIVQLDSNEFLITRLKDKPKQTKGYIIEQINKLGIIDHLKVEASHSYVRMSVSKYNIKNGDNIKTKVIGDDIYIYRNMVLNLDDFDLNELDILISELAQMTERVKEQRILINNDAVYSEDGDLII